MSDKGITCESKSWSYTKEQINRCYEILDANQWDIVKSFSVVLGERGIGPAPKDMVLAKLQELCAYKMIRGRNFESIWSAMMRDYSEMYSCKEVTT